MSNTDTLAKDWDKIVLKLSHQFSGGAHLDMESIMYLIGIQELGKGMQDFTKDDKLNLMHIAICKLLIPFGYYEFTHNDTEGWPHYKLLKAIPKLTTLTQTKLMQEAVLLYFKEKELL